MIKILMVDDESDFEFLTRQKFRRELNQNEFSLFFANNGEEALTIFSEHPNISLVITDLKMPGMDGLTLLEKVKEINPLIKSIVMSAYGETCMLRKAMNQGVFDFIIKPVDFKDLHETIHRAINHINKSDLKRKVE